jgi:hypothetical protein
MKRYLILSLLLILASCSQNKIEESESIHFIPPDAALILSHQDYSKYLEKLDKQNFLRTHKENSVIKFWSLQHWHDLVEMPEEFLLTYNVIGKNKLAQTLITKDFKNSSK